MKIALITEFDIHYAGGGERRYFEIARELVKRGHDVTWVCMRQKELSDQQEIDGIKILRLGVKVDNPPHRTIANFLSFMGSVIRHLITHRYDVVDAQPFSPLVAGYFGTLFTRARFIATIYDITTPSDDQFFERGKLGYVIEKLIYRFPYKRIVTISESVYKNLHELYGIKEKKMALVYCGADLEKVNEIAEPRNKTRDLIFIGRLVPHKHADDFIELCDRLKVKGAIIGQGPLEKRVRQQVKKSKYVTFLGKLEKYSDVLKEIKKSRILVLPSTREGFGIVLVEAGACGVPVIAYECNGVVDVIVDGKTGHIVPQRDIETLEKRTKELLSDPKRMKEMGAAGKKRALEKFTWKSVVDELEKVYKS